MNQDIYIVIEHLRGQVADISYAMLVAGRVLAGGTGGKVVAVLMGQQAQGLAETLKADRVLYFDHAALADFTGDAYQKVLAELIRQDQPRAVFFGHTSIGTDVASILSAKLALPLVSQCHTVSADAGTLKFASQTCGGKIMAEGELPGPTALATLVMGGYKPEEGRSAQPPEVVMAPVPPLEGLSLTVDHYIEPDASDVDISKEPVLISVGRGIQTQDNIELANDLAAALGGVVSASRPVVDQGWLPTTRLVGKSGKAVKPKLYLAIGISGAPEHSEAITGSDMIVAINTDPAAPIFSLAKYGAVMDLFDLLPVLTEQVQQAKGS
jgi:electron transfer flavoprotein alpha subunit